MRKKVDCPFCDGNGCCFCDHEGKIFVGPNEMIKSEDGLNSIGVKYLKQEDPGEIWPELWEHFLKEENVPIDFKRQHGMIIDTGPEFTCKGCGHTLEGGFCLRTPGYCYLCDPYITVKELIADKPMAKHRPALDASDPNLET